MEFTEQRWLFWGPLRWFRHRHVALLSAKENNWTGLYVSSLQLGLWHVVTRFSDVKLMYERPWRSCQGKSDGKYRRMSYVSPIFLDEIPLSPKWSVIKSYKIIIFLDDSPFETPVFPGCRSTGAQSGAVEVDRELLGDLWGVLGVWAPKSRFYPQVN